MHLEWHFEPSVVAGLLVLTGLYLAAIGPQRRRFPGGAPVPWGQRAAFLLGVLTLGVALVSPLDDLAEQYLFSAHMLQHVLLTLAAPPLLLLGTPSWVVRPALNAPVVRGAARRLTLAPVAFALFNGVFWVWHWPSLYDLALDQQGVHVFEHLTFIATAVLMWWPVCGPVPELSRLSYPLQLLYLFLNSLVGGALGALITLQGQVAYTWYGTAPSLVGMTPMDDQRLGGLIMWVGCATLYLLVMAAVFVVWASHEETDAYGLQETRY